MHNAAVRAVEPLGFRAVGAVGAVGGRLELDAQLATFVRARGPLRRALAAVAGRLVAARGWERLGFARLRDYAVERVGLSARSMQDLACVDAKLAELPQLEAALVSGSITWTKARLLARVATAVDECTWLARAAQRTARELSRDVRAVDRASIEAGALETDEDGAPEEERETVRIRCTPVVRAKWYAARQLARRVAGEALPVWGCMEAIGAEVLSSIPLEVVADLAPATARAASIAAKAKAANGCAPHGLPVSSEPGSSDPGSPPRVELPIFLRSLVHALDEADPFELDSRLRAIVALEQRLEATLAPLLLRIRDTRLYRTRGFATFDAYVRERLGVSPRKARALLRLERAGRRAPALMRAYRSGQLSWVQAHALVPIVLIDRLRRWSSEWIDWARRAPARGLEDDVERALVLYETDPETWRCTGGLPADDFSRNRQTGARPTHSEENAQLFFNAPRDVARLFRAVLCTVRRRIERQRGPDGRSATDGEALEVMLEHVFDAWGGSGCAPGSKRERVRNRVRAGRLRCTGKAPHDLRFALGIRDRRPPLLISRSSCDDRWPTPRFASSAG